MLTIIGCGNLNRSDDAVGAIIAQRLQKFIAENPYPNVQVYDCGTAGMEVMFQVPLHKQRCTSLSKQSAVYGCANRTDLTVNILKRR